MLPETVTRAAPDLSRRTDLLNLATALAACLALAAGPVDGRAAPRHHKEVAGLAVLLVVPEDHRGPLPLVVALHGCRQTAEAFLDASRLEQLAEREGFALAVPQAPSDAANPLGCWPWWQPEQQRRDGAAPRALAAITRAMDVPVDARRVYVLGFSSGGAMAAILGVVYPDVFTAVGIHSGIGFAAAGDVACALDVMEDGPGRAVDRGTLAYLHQSVQRIVPTMVIHGEQDEVVRPDHGRGLVRETAQRYDWIDNDRDDDSFDDEPDGTADDPGPCGTGDCYNHRLHRFEDHDGRVAMVRVVIEDLGHDWSGGAPDRRYSDPRGPDAGALFWSFFEGYRLDPGTLRKAPRRSCEDLWAAPWWHLTWGGTMSLAEYTCNMDPWRMVWRHQIEGVHGPGRCP